MKLAITSQGPDLTSDLDPRFGRAKCFIAYDTEAGAFEVHDNKQNVNAVQGAGIQAARLVADLKPDAVITGNIGPKAFSVLQQAGVKVYLGARGSVKEAIEQFQAGRLESADRPNVEGHWT